MCDLTVEPEMEHTREATNAQRRFSLAGRRKPRGICSKSQKVWKRVTMAQYFVRVESAHAWSKAN